jgi:GT2 family glycosyltransferase
VDVVVVAYRSGGCLRRCVEPLVERDDIRVFVADNGCPDDSTATVADLPVEIVRMGSNRGFATACNAAARRGDGEAILFLNPDAEISADSIETLHSTLMSDDGNGACGPAIRDAAGVVSPSVRRDPRLGSAFAEALFVHHLAPHAPWASELVWNAYETRHEAEWLSGAALCVRRSAFEQVGGFDERFFLYSEDADLCARLRAAGYSVVFEPAAVALHEGGASAPAPGQAALKAHARVRYARLHSTGIRYAAFRFAFVLYELVRIPVALARSRAHLRGRVASLSASLGGRPQTPPSRGKTARARAT